MRSSPVIGSFDEAAEAFAGVLIDDGHDLDRSAVGGGIELKVHRPHQIRGIRGRHAECSAGAQTFPSSALRHPQAFLAPHPLKLLVIHDPALGAGIVIGAAETPARMGFGIPVQPGAQCRVGVGRRRRRRLVSLCAPVLPGHPARKPLTDRHRRDEVVHGRAPTFRAQKFPVMMVKIAGGMV